MSLAWLKSSVDRFLPKHGFARKVGLLASGTAASQIITLLILPVLTRLFSPEQFGVLASYVAIVATVSVVGGLRYEMAIPLAANDCQAFHLFLLSVGSVFFVAVVTTVVVALVPSHVLPLGGIKWLIPVGLIGIGIYQALSFWALRNKAYKELAKTKFSQGIGRAVTQIGAGFLGAGAAGLALGEVVGRSAGILRLGWKERHRLRVFGRKITYSELCSTARTYREFPLLVSPAALLNSAGLQVPTLLIASLYGPVVAGWYFAAQRIVALPVQMVARAVGDVFLAEAPEAAKKDPARLRIMFRKVSNRLLLCGAVPAAMLIWVTPWIVPWLLGAEWKTAGVFLQLLTGAFVFALAYSPINFAIIGRNDYSFVWAAFRLITTAGSVTVSHFLGWSPVTCVATLSFAIAISYLVELKLWNWGTLMLIKRHGACDAKGAR